LADFLVTLFSVGSVLAVICNEVFRAMVLRKTAVGWFQFIGMRDAGLGHVSETGEFTPAARRGGNTVSKLICLL
jgi:hypothetical protein